MVLGDECIDTVDEDLDVWHLIFRFGDSFVYFCASSAIFTVLSLFNVSLLNCEYLHSCSLIICPSLISLTVSPLTTLCSVAGNLVPQCCVG